MSHDTITYMAKGYHSTRLPLDLVLNDAAVLSQASNYAAGISTVHTCMGPWYPAGMPVAVIKETSLHWYAIIC